MTLGGQAWALPIAIAVFSLVVGVAEEGSKFLGAWSLARHRHEFDEPIDGIIYGSAAALGFAAVENIKYFAVGRMSGVVIAVRAFITVPSHLFFGAIWGYALGRQLVSRKTSVLAMFALAALAHGTFDALLSTDGMQLASTALVLVLALGFVAMLRSALRYGAVRPRLPVGGGAPLTEPLPAGELARAYFRVGSPAAFYASAAGIVVCAFSLTLLGGAYEFLHHRIGVVFVSLATTMLALFGLAAYAASETIPLDVAIDAQGVTLGGALTPWRAVVSMRVDAATRRAQVVLHTTEASFAWARRASTPPKRSPRPSARSTRWREPRRQSIRDELDLEDQPRVRGDGRRTSAGAVSEIRWDAEATFAPDLHADDALIPALDHFALADRELEWVAAVIVRAVELRAVHQRPGVLDVHRVTGPRRAAGAGGEVIALELRRGGGLRSPLRRLEVTGRFVHGFGASARGQSEHEMRSTVVWSWEGRERSDPAARCASPRVSGAAPSAAPTPPRGRAGPRGRAAPRGSPQRAPSASRSDRESR